MGIIAQTLQIISTQFEFLLAEKIEALYSWKFKSEKYKGGHATSSHTDPSLCQAIARPVIRSTTNSKCSS
jgi:hypothetical protein